MAEEKQNSLFPVGAVINFLLYIVTDPPKTLLFSLSLSALNKRNDFSLRRKTYPV